MKKEGGHCATTTNRNTANLTVVGWHDNMAVYIISNCLGSQPSRSVRRWNKVERKYIQAEQPNQFHVYN